VSKFFLFFLRLRCLSCVIALLLLTINSAYAATFALPSNGDNVVGKVQWTQSLPGDTFTTVGRRYDIGYYQMVEANPGINPALPHPGTLLVIPTEFIIPNVPHTGVVVSLAELRVYYFPAGKHEVMTYPVGIGREGWSTPVGQTAIMQKVKNPTWVVPADIMKWRFENGGVKLPQRVGPGPANPLGGYALYLGAGYPGYRIHGTNDPASIGRRSSAGCIHLWPEDIEELFSNVTVGTSVRVVNDPYKAGWLNNQVYLESHTPLEEQQKVYAQTLSPMRFDVEAIIQHRPVDINWDRAKEVARQQNGIPQVISGASA